MSNSNKYQKADSDGITVGSKMNHIQKRMTEKSVPMKTRYNRNKMKQNLKQYV